MDRSISYPGSELIDVKAKVVIYEAFVEGKLEAPKHLARTVHDLYFEPKYEESRPRTDLESPQCIHIGIQATGSHPTVQSDSQAGRIPGSPVLTVVLIFLQRCWSASKLLRCPETPISDTCSTLCLLLTALVLLSGRSIRIETKSIILIVGDLMKAPRRQ